MKLKVIRGIRTNNFADERVMEKITGMWKTASSELSNHKDNIYGLYHEYESDYKGDYILCVAIEDDNEFSVVIPEDTKYEVFNVNTDDEQGIFKTWNKIWKREEEGQLKRSYAHDFEKYYPDGSIEIYIAVNEK